jgi:phosphotransferase system enzyme I (PtsP)
MQFLFAKDRGSSRIAERYDVLAPAALSCLAEIVRLTTLYGTKLSICGEMAGNPLEAMALVGLGFRCLSMRPSSIGVVKAMIRNLEVEPLRRYLTEQLVAPHHSLRENLEGFARDHGTPV